MKSRSKREHDKLFEIEGEQDAQVRDRRGTYREPGMSRAEWRDGLTRSIRAGDRVRIAWRSREMLDKTYPMSAADALGMCESLVKLGAEILAVYRVDTRAGLED